MPSQIPPDLTVAWPGAAEPLGVTVDADGANVALWAEQADAVDLCLIADDGTERRIRLGEQTFHVFHGYVPGLRPGQRQHPWPVGAEPELDVMCRRRARMGADDLIVDAAVADRAVTGGPALADDRDRLDQRVDRLARSPPRTAIGLDRVPERAGAEPELVVGERGHDRAHVGIQRRQRGTHARRFGGGRRLG